MRQAGRYLPEYRKIREKHDVLTICKTPELSSEITALPVERFDLDAAVIFADIMLPLQAIGISLEIKDEIGPIISTPIRESNQVKSLLPFDSSRLSFVYEAIHQTRRRINDSVPIIGFSGAPFTLASYIIEGGPSRDYALTKSFMHRNPTAWHDLMQKLASMVSAYLIEQVKAGASALQLFDSWVGCLSPSDYGELVSPYSKFIANRISELNVPLIHFGTNTASLLLLMKSAGGDVMSVDWRINIDDAWEMIGHDTAIQGNLDPAILLTNKEIIQKHAGSILGRTGGKPGHIFSLGHGVHPNTPPENVKTLVDFVHSYTAE